MFYVNVVFNVCITPGGFSFCTGRSEVMDSYGTVPLELAEVELHFCLVTHSSGLMFADIKNLCQVFCVKVSLLLTTPTCRLALFCQRGSCLSYRKVQQKSQTIKGNQLRLICHSLNCPYVEKHKPLTLRLGLNKD